MLQKHSIYLLVSFFAIALLFQGCSPKYIYPEKILERGFETYDTSIHPVANDTVFFTKKNRVEVSATKEGYWELTYPQNAYHFVYKTFHKNGNIKVKGVGFGIDNVGVGIGTTETFNEEGKLIKAINEEEPYGDKFNYNDILDYLHKRRVINKYRKKPYQIMEVSFNEDKKEWQIRVYETRMKKSGNYEKETVSTYEFDTEGNLLFKRDNAKIIYVE